MVRILLLLIIGLLVSGNAAADNKRDASQKWQGYRADLVSKSDKPLQRHQRQGRYSSRLSFLRASGLNSGVCDELKGTTRGLRMMCIAFCELQSCSPDFTAEEPFQNCSRSSRWILARYEARRGPGDPDMPCIKQPEAVAECPCWSREELASFRGQGADDRLASCTLDLDYAESNISNFDNWRVLSQTAGAYSVSLSSFGSYGTDRAPTCAVSDTCADGSCLGESRLMTVTAEQFAACEADVALSAADRGLICR